MTEYHWLSLIVAACAWTWFLLRQRDGAVTVAVEMCKRLIDTQNEIIERDRDQVAVCQAEITRLSGIVRRPASAPHTQRVEAQPVATGTKPNGRLRETVGAGEIAN